MTGRFSDSLSGHMKWFCTVKHLEKYKYATENLIYISAVFNEVVGNNKHL